MELNSNKEFMTISEIASEFGYNRTTITNIRAFIRKHSDRYGYYGVTGHLTSRTAFLDAVRFKAEITKGYPVPTFDPKNVRQYEGGLYGKE